MLYNAHLIFENYYDKVQHHSNTSIKMKLACMHLDELHTKHTYFIDTHFIFINYLP